MPSGRFPVQNIETLMPSVDARSSDRTHLLDGKNFIWDSMGPKSGFGALQLSPFPIGRPEDVHAIRTQGRSLVFTQDSILAWRRNAPYMWELIHTFETAVPLTYRTPWQVIYLNGKLYLSHPYRGFYSADVENEVENLWLAPQTDSDIPGLPKGIKGMTVVRGRAIIVTDFTIQWSDTGDLSDLTPGLAGAGLQVIAGIVKGTYVALTGFQDGFIVWTTEGAVLAQFTGDDLVWRFDPLVSLERPLSAWTTVELTTGASGFLSRRGLFISGNGDNPQAWTPQFNEFFREYTQRKDLTKSFFRLEYDSDSETIYILESMDMISFERTFALKPTIDKWGLFSEHIYGMLPVNGTQYGYVDLKGVAYYFAEQFSREIEPDNALGYDRHYPRFEKRLDIPSSTLVSRAVDFDKTAPSELSTIPRGAWYTPGSFLPVAPALGGMDSWIEIGYLRPDQVQNAADTYTEFQEIALGGVPVSPNRPPDWTTDWKPGYFYAEEEDWESPGQLTHGNRIFDLMLESGAEDFLIGPDYGHEDYQFMDFPTVVFPDGGHEDWEVDSGAEDWGGPVSGYPTLHYRMVIRSSQDGITFDELTPDLAKFNTQTQEYAVIAQGTYHSIRLDAVEYGEWFHVKALDLTMIYAGQQS